MGEFRKEILHGYISIFLQFSIKLSEYLIEKHQSNENNHSQRDYYICQRFCGLRQLDRRKNIPIFYYSESVDTLNLNN
jgi:hypothetical protein